VRSKWKFTIGMLCPALVLLLAGCGGFHASPSISPASFFLPGLIQSRPPAPVPEVETAEKPIPTLTEAI
jgi:hypothetical protein